MSLTEFLIIFLIVASLFIGVIEATIPAQKRLEERRALCLKAICPVGKPELTYFSVFSEGKCVCLPPEPRMPQ
jgi:hypothetical protein